MARYTLFVLYRKKGFNSPKILTQIYLRESYTWFAFSISGRLIQYKNFPEITEKLSTIHQ